MNRCERTRTLILVIGGNYMNTLSVFFKRSVAKAIFIALLAGFVYRILFERATQELGRRERPFGAECLRLQRGRQKLVWDVRGQ